MGNKFFRTCKDIDNDRELKVHSRSFQRLIAEKEVIKNV